MSLENGRDDVRRRVESIPDRIRYLKGNQTTTSFAKQLGVGVSTLHNYENGRVPPIDVLLLISQKTGASLTWLVTGEGDPYGGGGEGGGEGRPVRRVLVVDDQDYQRQSISNILEADGYTVFQASNVSEAVGVLEGTQCDVVVTDLRMPGEDDGLRLLKWIQETRPDTRTIIITVHAATARAAVEAIREGASDYLVMSPKFPEELSEAVRNAFEEVELQREPGEGGVSDFRFGRLLGTSPEMRQVFAAVRQAAKSAGLPILVEGAPGTGKELTARTIHEADPGRRGHPFIALNCGAMTADALHHEIFGSGMASGDGDTSGNHGILSRGWAGTLYLEEIEQTNQRLQVDLLRLLETGEVAFGSGAVARLNRGRIVCGTTADLDAAVADGEFRPDLLSRLRVLSIRIPALCDRKDDIGVLAEHFIAEFCADARRPEPAISDGALEILREVQWPENVRELRGVIERALICFPRADELGEDAILEVLGGAGMHSSVLGTA